MSDWKPKRFWTSVDVVTAPSGFAVELDGRSVKTPAKNALLLPTRDMAQAVADEWHAQVDKVDPATMPVTKTANAAIDKVMVQHAEVADMLAAYGDSDLLCYRADAPAELVDRQAEIWDPMLDWAEGALGVRLIPRTGIMHQAQDANAITSLTRQVHALDAFELAAFHDLVSLSGSLILAFAATKDTHPAAALWDISRLDEEYQTEQWGRDEEADALTAIKRESFLHAKRMFDLAQGGAAPLT